MADQGPAAAQGDIGRQLFAEGGLADARFSHHHHQSALPGHGPVKGRLKLL